MAGFMLYVEEIEGAIFVIPTFSAFGYMRDCTNHLSQNMWKTETGHHLVNDFFCFFDDLTATLSKNV